jgi:hypothetical protein
MSAPRAAKGRYLLELFTTPPWALACAQPPRASAIVFGVRGCPVTPTLGGDGHGFAQSVHMDGATSAEFVIVAAQWNSELVDHADLAGVVGSLRGKT